MFGFIGTPLDPEGGTGIGDSAGYFGLKVTHGWGIFGKALPSKKLKKRTTIELDSKEK